MNLPFCYNKVDFDSYKERSPIMRIRAESEKQKELNARKWEKKEGPSPTSYKVSESFNST
jgi:hypothetical protein